MFLQLYVCVCVFMCVYVNVRACTCVGVSGRIMTVIDTLFPRTRDLPQQRQLACTQASPLGHVVHTTSHAADKTSHAEHRPKLIVGENKTMLAKPFADIESDEAIQGAGCSCLAVSGRRGAEEEGTVTRGTVSDSNAGGGRAGAGGMLQITALPKKLFLSAIAQWQTE